MQEIVDREVERGPGTVDRRAGQVWRETREALTGWGRKPRVRPGRLRIQRASSTGELETRTGSRWRWCFPVSSSGVGSRTSTGAVSGAALVAAPAGAMAEDVADASAAGGYAALHERGRLAQSRAWLVRRHARFDPAWSGRVGRADGDGSDPRGAEPSGRRAPSPERLQRAWDDARSRSGAPAPPRAEVRPRSRSQPRASRVGMSGHGDASSNGASETILARHPDRARSALPPAPAPRVPSVTSRAALRMRARLDLDRPVRLSEVLRDHPGAYDASKRRVSVVERRVSEIDADVPRAVCLNVERLYVSRNRIRDFSNLTRFPALRLLSAGDNPVDDVRQLDRVARACPRLEALSLELTPLSRAPWYRAHVLARMPNLRSLDGREVTNDEVARAPRDARTDVANLEALMSARATADKLRRCVKFSDVFEELRRVVFAPGGPVAPASLPSRDDVAAPLDARRFLKYCVPEKAMTPDEVAGMARDLRAAVSAEAPEARRVLKGDSADDAFSPEKEFERATWEAAYQRALRKEQSFTTSALALLDDREFRAEEVRRARERNDPFGAALRFGREAHAAREAEWRSDRERALTDLVELEDLRAERMDREKGGKEDDPAEADWAEGTIDWEEEAIREAARREEEEASLARAKASNARAREMESAERRDAWASWAEEEARAGASSGPHRRPARSRPGADPVPKVPWGHGPGGAAERRRAALAAAARTGETSRGREVARAGRRRPSERRGLPAFPPPARSVSPPRERRHFGNDEGADRVRGRSAPSTPARRTRPGDFSGVPGREEEPVFSFARRDANERVLDSGSGGSGSSLYDALCAEVDALRGALESHAAGEAELLSANAALLERAEAAEAAYGEARHGDGPSARAKTAEALRESLEATRAAEAHARELAAALDETAHSADAAESAKAEAERRSSTLEATVAALEARLATETAEKDALRAELATNIADAENASNALAHSRARAARWALREWTRRVAKRRIARVLRTASRRRCVERAFAAWRARGRAQKSLRAVVRERERRATTATIRAWRLAALVHAVDRCLTKRRSVRLWLAKTRKRARLREIFADEGVTTRRAALEALRRDSEGREDSFEENNSSENDATFETREALAILRQWSDVASDASRASRLEAYAEAVLAAARPSRVRLASRAALASALSAWHLEVTRSQQTRLETLVQTCDALGGAAAEAAETATATEARCATLEEARGEAEDRAKVLERRVRGQEEETRGAEALAAAAAGVAAAWRVAAERGVSAAKEATERLANWSAEIERDRGGFLRAVGHSTEKKKKKKNKPEEEEEEGEGGSNGEDATTPRDPILANDPVPRGTPPAATFRVPNPSPDHQAPGTAQTPTEDTKRSPSEEGKDHAYTPSALFAPAACPSLPRPARAAHGALASFLRVHAVISAARDAEERLLAEAEASHAGASEASREATARVRRAAELADAEERKRREAAAATAVQSAFRGHKARSAMRSAARPRRDSRSPPPGDGESLPAAESPRGDEKPPRGDEKPRSPRDGGAEEGGDPRDAWGGPARTTPGKKKSPRGKARGGERAPENDGGFGFEFSNENAGGRGDRSSSPGASRSPGPRRSPGGAPGERNKTGEEKARKAAATSRRGSSAGKPRATRPGGGSGARGRGTTEDDEGGSPGRVLDRFLNHNPYGVAKRLLREAREAPGEAPASPPSRAPFSPPPWKPASYTIFDSPSAHPPPDF